MLQRHLQLGFIRTLFTSLVLASVCGGMALMAQHTYSPGTIATARSVHWPQETEIPWGIGRLNCIIFMHPHCPCSQSTLSQIESLLSDAMDVKVVLVLPQGVPDGWEKGSVTARLEQMPQMTYLLDRSGVQAGLFGAATSGHLFLYDAEGLCLFNGGITPGRGQVGPSSGLATFRQALISRHQATTSAPVFGCALLGK